MPFAYLWFLLLIPAKKCPDESQIEQASGILPLFTQGSKTRLDRMLLHPGLMGGTVGTAIPAVSLLFLLSRGRRANRKFTGHFFWALW